MKKALIAMSGGVDSSLAAKLTQQLGYTCIGCTMKLHGDEPAADPDGRTCCTASDAEDARAVAAKLGMPFYVFNFTDDFRETVMAHFIAAYERGCTPNPCIECNRTMKFEKLFERAQVLGCDTLVTGHYARIEQQDGRYVLKKALDESKDQSYVLYSMTPYQLAHTLFPLGDVHKTDVRRMAEESGFCNAHKPDSQDICFVPDGDYCGFICRHTGKTYPAGNFIDESGRVLGRHNGIIHYTVGQRKGLGIAFGKPMYVKAVNAADNTVVLSEEAGLYTTSLLAERFNWTAGEAPEGPIACRAKIRYRQPEQEATAEPLPDGTVRITFARPQRAVTPGQAAVLYSGDVVLGGGTIVRAE